jgi:AAA family ATP:ADP antiporter
MHTHKIIARDRYKECLNLRIVIALLSNKYDKMVDHDPFPMRSEEARRLAASVQNDDDCDDGGKDEKARNAAVVGGGGGDGGPSWHKMGTALAQRLPKFFRKNSGAGIDRESLVAKKKKNTGSGRKAKTSRRKGGGEESIYDRDELDEAKGIDNDDGGGGDDDDDEDDGDDGADEDFIDAPLRGDRPLLRPEDVSDLPWPVGPIALRAQGCYYGARGAARSAHRRLYGDTWSWDDFVRTMVLSSTLFVMIGGYWLLRSLKDVVMTALCGVGSIPKAKMLSVFVVLGVVAVYNRLLDSSFRKEQLFYVFGTFYLVLFSGIAYLLGHPTIGLANQVEDPSRVLGWVSYCGIESFGSVMVALFWSFANSSFNLKQAKRSYGVMVATAQLGSILGPTFVSKFSLSLGIPACYMVGASCMLTLQFTMWVYVKMFGAPPEASSPEKDAGKKDDSNKKPKAGILEGIHLFVNHNYVKGIFAISCLYEVEVTIVVRRDVAFLGTRRVRCLISCWLLMNLSLISLLPHRTTQ